MAHGYFQSIDYWVRDLQPMEFAHRQVPRSSLILSVADHRQTVSLFSSLFSLLLNLLRDNCFPVTQAGAP
jgi:hypothetical protein